MDMKKITVDFEMDFSKIEESLAAKAEKELIEKVTDAAETMIFSHRNYYSTYNQPKDRSTRNGINEPIVDIIKEFMNDNKEEIIERVAQNLTKRLAMGNGFKNLKNSMIE